MTARIAIVGAGEVGAATAFALLRGSLYSELLLPEPAIPALANGEVASDPASLALHEHARKAASAAAGTLPFLALGLGPSSAALEDEPVQASGANPAAVPNRAKDSGDSLPAPYKTTSLPLSDRLAARDRAYTLLSTGGAGPVRPRPAVQAHGGERLRPPDALAGPRTLQRGGP